MNHRDTWSPCANSECGEPTDGLCDECGDSCCADHGKDWNDGEWWCLDCIAERTPYVP
jgi:hypothetical protein